MKRRSLAWIVCAAVSMTAPVSLAVAQASSEAGPVWSFELFAGGGFGSREFAVPMDSALYRTDTGIFPAAEVGFELSHEISRNATFGVVGRYQSSVGLHIRELHTDGSERRQALRSHRLELAFAPVFRLDARGRWAVLASLGYGLSDVRPEVHVLTPGYGLGGPFLRLELRVPLGSKWLRLRLGPEAQWIVGVGEELVDRGVEARGYGAGGTAAIELAFDRHWVVEAGYRELRVWLGSREPGSFTDVARFATARLRGALW